VIPPARCRRAGAKPPTGTPWPVPELVRRLRRFHGKPTPPRPIDPLSELVMTILSQNTSDTNSARAFASLRRRFRSWKQAAEAPAHELAEAIRPGGLANVKASRIQAILKAIRRRRGRYSLKHLRHLPPAQARQELADFFGVGPKTVACVLLFACRMPVLPVDTHVHRVSQRLGLIGPKVGAAKAHELLERMVPPADVLDFHLLLIRHGRQVCVARRPWCSRCVLAGRCPARRAFEADGRAR